MKTANNLPKLIVSISLTAAILVAIVVCSFAWFSSSNVTVRATDATFESQGFSSLIIETRADESYGRYMGQTGIEYNGTDSPYYFVYSPFHVDAEVLQGDTIGPYFTYRLTEGSKVTLVIAGEKPVDIDENDGWKNFSMELHRVAYNAETEEYDETGDVYRSENGYFRNLSTGDLLSFEEETDQYFSLYIYFQGDVGIDLLKTTRSDLDSKFTFDYCDQKFMFSTFTLSTVFNLETLGNLRFMSDGYDSDDSYSPIYRSNSLQFSIPSTGFNLKDANGDSADWPIAELYDNGNVDYSYYFIDWASREYDQEESKWEFYIYRQTSASDDIYTLSLRPLRHPDDQLTAVVGESKSLSLEFNSSRDNETYYIRPSSTYYSNTGKAVYNYDTQTITIKNPTVVDNEVQLVDSSVIAPPEKDGYFFVGWSAEEEATYTNGVLNDAFRHTDMVLSDDTTLYAVWKELVYVNLSIPTSWGSNYATIGNMNVTFGEEDYTPTNGTLRIRAEKGTAALATLQLYSATATATIGANTRGLTLKGWAYQNGDEWVTLNSGTDFILSEETTFMAIWNERKTYSITLDLYQKWKYLASNYAVMSRLSISNPVVLEGYTLKFNGNSTGSFSGSSSNPTVTLSNIPEGVKYNQLGIGSPTCYDTDGIYQPISYKFEKWSTDSNEWEGDNLNSAISDAATFSMSQVVNDTTTASMTNNTLYAFFKRPL